MRKLLYSTAAFVFTFTSIKAQSTASLNFDGVDDLLTTNTTETVSGSFTIEAWVKANSTAPMKIFSTRNSSSDFGFDFDISNGYLIHGDIGNGSGWLTTNAEATFNYTIGQWFHIAYVVTNTGYSIYANGNLIGSGTYSGIPLLLDALRNKMTIGSDTELTGSYMLNGAVDEVRVWNIARSQTEIKNNLNSTITAQTGLITYYNFNDGIPYEDNTSLLTVTDLSGSNYDGGLTNFALTGTSSNFSLDVFQRFTENLCLPNIGTNRTLISSADFDADGTTDFIATLNQTWLYKGTGSGNFDTPIQLFSNVRTIESKDIDGDGDVDFIAFTGNNTAEIYTNDGGANFTLSTSITLSGNISNITLGDVNGDGKMDILLGNSGGNKTEIWLNNGTVGNASFAFASEFNGVYTDRDLGDVDNDGDIDFVGGSHSNYGYLYINDGNGNFTLQTTFNEYSANIKLFDWNNDGHLDKIIYDRYNNYGFRVSINDGSGGFQFPSTLWAPVQALPAHKYVIADFNADGYPDVVFDKWGGNAEVFLNTGCALVKDNNSILSQSSHGVYVGDYNNDQRPDIFCIGRDATSCMQINVMDAATFVPLSDIDYIEGDVRCAGNSASLYASASNGGTVNWYNSISSGSLLNTGNDYSTPILSISTTYYVDVTNANGCTSSPRMAVTAAINQHTTGDTTATACESFTWYSNIYTTSNDYTHVLTNDLGCDSTVTLHLTINQPTTGDTTATTCESFTWYSNTYTASNDYTHVLTNAAGCDSTVTLHLTIDNININVTQNSSILSADQNGATYQWIDCDNSNQPISGETEQTFTATANGNYAVEITNGSCSETSACVSVISVGIEVNKTENIKLFPNPTNGQFTVSGIEPNAAISVYNAIGELLMFVQSTGNSLSIDINEFTNGMYLIKVKTEHGEVIKKLNKLD